MSIIENYKVRTNSHIINLLGDELIGSDSLALFEIVKNSYDADANVVTINLNNLFSENRSIVIEDDGNGMTPEVIANAWLTIGTDYIFYFRSLPLRDGACPIPTPLHSSGIVDTLYSL